MDKKNTIIGVVLLVAGMALMFWQNGQRQDEMRERQRQQAAQMAEQQAARQDAAPEATGTEQQPAAQRPMATYKGPDPLTLSTPEEAARDTRPEEQLAVLENDFIRVEFTSWGGAIRNVAFLKYDAVQAEKGVPYVFNAHSEMPALTLGMVERGDMRGFGRIYTLVDQTDDSVVYRCEPTPGITIERTYTIFRTEDGAQPYTIQHSTRLINGTDQVVNPQSYYVSLGTAAPEQADSYGFSLSASYFDGSNYEYERINKFTSGGGFLFFKSDPEPFLETPPGTPVLWAAVKNQFFTAILTPKERGTRMFMDDVVLDTPAGAPVERGITGALQFEVPAIQPGTTASLDMDFYTGPKEYRRLSTLAHEQDRVMQFGWSFIGFIGKALYSVLIFFQGFLGNWGVAIIILTITVRALFWPLTAKAAESSRKMSKLQGPIKELKEKYKDNPQKLNTEMMALWKRHKVNPLAGCLPVLIQIPIFLGLYYMLRAASELRFEHFLWIQDLSLPDTIGHIAGFPINPLPLVMGVSMFFQMRLAPTPSMDATQAKLMQFMPLMFLFFSYNFASGLVLYWTMSNCMSILQQLYTNNRRRKEEEVGTVPATTVATPATGVNVTKRSAARASAKGRKRKN